MGFGEGEEALFKGFPPLPRFSLIILPQIGFNNFRIAAHDVGRTAGDKRTVLKYKELLAHLHDEAHVVLDEQNRHPRWRMA